jgi:hypothetical protein
VWHERFERYSRRVGSPRTKHLAATIEAPLKVVKKMPCVSASVKIGACRKNARCAASSCVS